LKSNEKKNELAKFNDNSEIPFQNFLHNVSPNLRILLENLFRKSNFESDKSKRMYSNLIFEKPSNLGQIGQDMTSQNDFLKSNFNVYQNKDDDFYKYISAINSKKKMIHDNPKPNFINNPPQMRLDAQVPNSHKLSIPHNLNKCKQYLNLYNKKHSLRIIN
jgi:hypothetical protein